jgi:hypothetical protein
MGEVEPREQAKEDEPQEEDWAVSEMPQVEKQVW